MFHLSGALCEDGNSDIIEAEITNPAHSLSIFADKIIFFQSALGCSVWVVSRIIRNSDGVLKSEFVEETRDGSCSGISVDEWLYNLDHTYKLSDKVLKLTNSNGECMPWVKFAEVQTGTCYSDAECSDLNPCTIDSCTDMTCSHQDVEDGTVCDDGQYCTVDESCQGGECTGTARDCGETSSDCTQMVCDEDQDACVEEPTGVGTDCDDGKTWLFPSYPGDLNFGYSVAVSGDVVVVGAETGTASLEPGTAYVFRRTGGEWVEEARLESDRDHFGSSLSVSGDLIVAGCHLHETGGNYEGRAYVFRYDGDQWTAEATLSKSDSVSPDYNYFGYDVSIDGQRIAVATPCELHREDGMKLGAAFLFAFDGSDWQEEAMLTAPEDQFGGRIGGAVSLSGEVAVVGQAYFDTDVYTGEAYVFRRTGDTWQIEQSLTAWGPGANSHDHFGAAVSVSGEVIMVSARQDVELGTQMGAVYVYRYDGSTWQAEEILYASDAPPNAFFGDSISLSGDRAIMGTGAGLAYVFRLDGSSWKQERLLWGSVELFAWGYVQDQPVGLSGTVAVIGAYGNYASIHDGAVCILDLSDLPPADLCCL
jgi:hypothetical protein